MNNKLSKSLITLFLFFNIYNSSVNASEIVVSKEVGITDRFIFPENEILVNPSFETINDKGTFPLGFGITKPDMKFFAVHDDFKNGKHGGIYLTIKNKNKKGLTSTLYTKTRKSFDKLSGDIKISCWLKGKGTLWLSVAYYSNKKRKSILLHSVKKYVKIKSLEWQKYSWTTNLFEALKGKIKSKKVKDIVVRFIFKGDMSIDKLSAMRVEDIKLIQEREQKNTQKSLLVCNKTSTPIKIDGKIGSKEWGKASGTSAFIQMGSLTLSDRQTKVFTAYDNEKLYFAFKTKRKRLSGVDKKSDGKAPSFSKETNGIEVWLKTPAKKPFHFLGMLNGDTLSTAPDKKLSRGTDWDYKVNLQDSGETSSGILTFSTNIWTSEASISFKNLGIATPKDGDVLFLSFCSDYAVSEEKPRTSKDWTIWPGESRNFGDTKTFAKLRFQEKVQSIKIFNTGHLSKGILNIEGKIYSEKDMLYNIKTTIASKDDSTKILYSNFRQVNITSKKESDFLIHSLINIKNEMNLVLDLTVSDNNSILYKTRIPFKSDPPFSMNVVPLYEKKKLCIQINTTLTKNLPKLVEFGIEILNQKSKKSVLNEKMILEKDKLNDILTFNMSNFSPSKYVLNAYLSSKGNKKHLYETKTYLKVPDLKQFVWINNKLGISDKVPPPWTAVKAKKSEVYITERVYSLQSSGIPNKVNIKGINIFQNPPQIHITVNSKIQVIKYNLFDKVEEKETYIKWKFAGKAKDLVIEGELRVEFDGFALWKFSLKGTDESIINSFYIDFPFKKEKSLYIRGANYTINNGKYYACLFSNKKATDMKIAMSHVSEGAWNWANITMNDVWIGDDTGGFAVMTETDENFYGNKRCEIIADNKTNTLRYNIISENVKLNSSLNYKFAWQATPVKPSPKNPKIWHTPSDQKDRNKKGYKKRVYISIAAYWALHPLCYPGLRQKKKRSDAFRKNYQKSGVKMTPYFGLAFVGTEIKEWEYFKKEWELHPQNIWSYLGGRAGLCNTSSSFANYIVWAAKEVYDKLGYDGIYLDVSDPTVSANPFQGAGYTKNGKRYPTANIFALREVYKRIYNLYKAESRKGFIYKHILANSAIAGFADVTMEGESWCLEKFNQYKRLTPEIFRLREMKIQYGTPYMWYTFHHYYRGEQYGGRVPMNEILTYCLPHKVLPSTGGSDIWPIWDLLDEWWTSSEFVPYWSKECPISADKKNILTSVYKKDKKSILIVANWNNISTDFELKINPDKLFKNYNNEKITLKNARTNKTLLLENNKINLSLNKKDLFILEINLEGI